jgi:hypothetical protein
MFNHFIQTFIDAQTAAWRHYRAVAATETRLFGHVGDPAVRVLQTTQIEHELRRTYETLANRIIFKARSDFAKGSGRPVVCRETVFMAAGFDIERSLALGKVPDFDKLWNVLQVQLSGLSDRAGEAR